MFLAMEERNLEKAEAIQHNAVKFHRSRSSKYLNQPLETLNNRERNTIRWLGVALEQLGHIQREQGKPECVNSYQEAIPNYQLAGDKSAEATAAFNLGHAYTELSALRNLDEAERWYRRSLELRADGDKKGRAITVGQLGRVAKERFIDAKKEGKSAEEEFLKHLNVATDCYQQALTLLPPDAVDDLAVAHNQLGGIYYEINDIERTIYHSNQCIHYMELGNDIYGAGTIRRNVALALANNGRLSDALLYAKSALRNFESYGGRAKQDEDQTKYLIGEIEKLMKK
jgi:hypothetical protein